MAEQTMIMRFDKKDIVKENDTTFWIDTRMTPEQMILLVAMGASAEPGKAVVFDPDAKEGEE